MAVNTDDLARLRQQAAAHVGRVVEQARQRYLEPETQRQELAEYDSLTPEQHARIMRTRGADEYQEWADAMEQARQRWHGQTTTGDNNPAQPR